MSAYVESRIEGNWLVDVVDEHTCGAGGAMGHEPGCGLIPVVDLRGLPGWDSLVAQVRTDQRERIAAAIEAQATREAEPKRDDETVTGYALRVIGAGELRRAARIARGTAVTP